MSTPAANDARRAQMTMPTPERLAEMIAHPARSLPSFRAGELAAMAQALLPSAAVASSPEQPTCEDCNGTVHVWFAPNKLWNLVKGGPEATDDPGGQLCPNCFILRAEAAGIVPTAWILDQEVLSDPSPPTEPLIDDATLRSATDAFYNQHGPTTEGRDEEAVRAALIAALRVGE